MTQQQLSLSAVEAALTVASTPRAMRQLAQPIIDTTTGEVAGYELLARFPPEWGLSPDQVFAAAEAHGVSARLTCAVLAGAATLRDALPPRTFLTLNCSPADLVSDAVLEVLSRMDLSRVFVELTETAWPDDEEAVLSAVDLVRDRGGRIAADDVGSGYAGLLQLIRLRPELVKIDREIVQRVDFDVAAEALIAMLGSFVGRLDAWLVAEGVETAGQLGALVRLGVPLVQGFYLGTVDSPWSGTTRVEEVRQLRRSSSVQEHLSGHQRPAAEGELVIDRHGRAASIRIPGEGAVRPLTMAPSTTVAEAVLRSMSRGTPLERIAPIVLTDESGRTLGVVPVERLVETLATDEEH